jgi:hypothetical protein
MTANNFRYYLLIFHNEAAYPLKLDINIKSKWLQNISHLLIKKNG